MVLTTVSWCPTQARLTVTVMVLEMSVITAQMIPTLARWTLIRMGLETHVTPLELAMWTGDNFTPQSILVLKAEIVHLCPPQKWFSIEMRKCEDNE